MCASLRSIIPVMLLASFAAVGPAQAQVESEFAGVWLRDTIASKPMKEIVADGMSKLGRIYRMWPISTQAKRRFEDTNRPYSWMQIIPAPDSVTIKTDFYTLVTPRNGILEKWEREKGDFIDVTTRWEGERIEQRFDAEDGSRVNVYTLTPDGGTLYLDVTVTSPKLDSPLEYRMVYRKRT